MKTDTNGKGSYRKLIAWRNFEVPVPGKEAIVGFSVVLIVCLLLYLAVFWLCSMLARG